MENITNIKIWLDDVRPAPEGYTHVHSVNEAKRLIMYCEANDISIIVIDVDNDLGDYACNGGDGYVLVDWLAETRRFYNVEIHSQNAVAVQNMRRTIQRYWPKTKK